MARSKRSRPLPSWFKADIDILEAISQAAIRAEEGVPYFEPFFSDEVAADEEERKDKDKS